MHFQVKIQENRAKNILRDKQRTNKVPNMFFDVKLVTET